MHEVSSSVRIAPDVLVLSVYVRWLWQGARVVGTSYLGHLHREITLRFISAIYKVLVNRKGRFRKRTNLLP